jgi:hypothetical protein
MCAADFLDEAKEIVNCPQNCLNGFEQLFHNVQMTENRLICMFDHSFFGESFVFYLLWQLGQMWSSQEKYF